MLKRYTFWLWLAVVFQFLTAAFHALSLFVSPEPQNESERQLFTLLATYRIDAGAGFNPTFGNLFTALSSCFSLLCLLGGAINCYLLRKRLGADLFLGIILINLLIFGVTFVVMFYFTFLPPIIMTGLVFGLLMAAFFAIRFGNGR